MHSEWRKSKKESDLATKLRKIDNFMIHDVSSTCTVQK